jgi:hypothetical protein
VQEDNTGTKHPAPLVLNGPSQFLQRFTVKLSIHHLTSGQEVGVLSQNTVHITFRADNF